MHEEKNERKKVYSSVKLENSVPRKLILERDDSDYNKLW